MAQPSGAQCRFRRPAVGRRDGCAPHRRTQPLVGQQVVADVAVLFQQDVCNDLRSQSGVTLHRVVLNAAAVDHVEVEECERDGGLLCIVEGKTLFRLRHDALYHVAVVVGQLAHERVDVLFHLVEVNLKFRFLCLLYHNLLF